MSQAALFDLPDLPKARRRDPHTSREAARTARSVIDLVREAFVGRALTADEVVDHLHRNGCSAPEPTIEGAVSRLFRAGVIDDTGATRLSRYGKPQMVRRLHSSYRPIETVVDPQGRVA